MTRLMRARKRKKDDSLNPDERLNILSPTMADVPTSSSVPTTPPVSRVLDSRRKVVKPVLKSSPGPSSTRVV